MLSLLPVARRLLGARRPALVRQARGAALVVAALAAPSLAAAADLQIRTLSNRADLISGGDALVEVVVPPDISPANVRVSLNGVDVSAAFAVRADGRFYGLVDGLQPNDNDLRAHVTSAPTPRAPAHLRIVNHPIGGPVFSGHQLLPWICARRAATSVLVTVPGTSLSAPATTRVSGLDADPVDDACNAPSKLTFWYQPKAREGTACQFTNTGGNRCFEPYDPASPPAEADIADFTNDHGDTVKSIVLVERGTINRGIYELATFYDPTKPSAPWAPQKGWNGKVLWTFGGGTSASRFQSVPAGSVWDSNALRRGFMSVKSSLTDHGTSANTIMAAETVMMVKEHIAETYGEIRYAIGLGCSGGAIMQHNIAAAHPGVLDGLMVSCTYPDTLSARMEVQDCGLLQNRFYATPIGSAFSLAKRAAINGHLNTGFCQAWINSFLGAAAPSTASNCGTGFPTALTYNAALRPDGVRCAGLDHLQSLLGQSIDTDGITKTNSPADNVGLQYGLKPLQSGAITPEEFVQVNEGVGSYTLDFDWNPSRRATASPFALATVYSSGMLSDARQLARTPIIDMRGNQPTNGDVHMNWRAWSVRHRLDTANGHHGNQAIWAHTGSGASLPSGAILAKALETMDAWLAGIEADASALSLEQKVLANKPADAADFCLANNGSTEAGLAAKLPLDSADCPVKFQSSPRQVAGGSLSENIFKCQLKPLDFASDDYAGVTFTSEQQTRLAAVFPGGVCDWSKPGVGQVPSNGRSTFKSGPGGEPMGPEPVTTLGPSLISGIGAAKVWIGLKNTDDVGTYFDLQAAVYKNGGTEPIGMGELRRTAPAGSGFNNARQNLVPITLNAPVEIPPGTVLTFKLGARITCTGATHSAGSARFWFGDAQAASGLAMTIDGVAEPFYVRTGSALDDAPGTAKAVVDTALGSRVACNALPAGRPYVQVGSWSVVVE